MSKVGLSVALPCQPSHSSEEQPSITGENSLLETLFLNVKHKFSLAAVDGAAAFLEYEER